MAKIRKTVEGMRENTLFDLEKGNSENNTCQKLISMLPYIAKMVILDRPENENFKRNSDDPNEHVVNWHQFGIITHTLLAWKSYQAEAQQYLKKWNINLKISKKFQERIEGKSKSYLLQISIIFHDLGKFARNFKESNGRNEHDFYEHEAMSEKLIVENEFIYRLLHETFQITETQIKYIARCAGLHFELGKARDASRKTTQGYSISFAHSEQCQKSCMEIASKFPQFKEEIGILFLCDSLAKTDVRIDAETDVEIENQTSHVENIIRERNLNPELIKAIKQLPVSIAIARRYLESI